MRSLDQVNVRRSVCNWLSAVRFVQVRSLLILIAITATIACTANVIADETNPPKPQIINFSVTFDGFDQFYVSGQVIGVDNPDGLTVEFGDYISGLTTETAFGGYFGMIFVSSTAEFETFSAMVTSHEGVRSDWFRDWIW
jgi:hypothetical protein